MKSTLLAIAAVLVVTAMAAPTTFAQRGGTTFTELRSAIADNVEPGKQRSYLAKVEHAEVQLPPNPCVALHSLEALSHHVDAQAGKKSLSTEGAQVVQAAIALTTRTYLPPGPCTS